MSATDRVTTERLAEIRDLAEHFHAPMLNEVLWELDRARAEITALREREKDAARIDWLEENATNLIWWVGGGCGAWVSNDDGLTIRASIDAALTKGGE